LKILDKACPRPKSAFWRHFWDDVPKKRRALQLASVFDAPMSFIAELDENNA